jgi:uncharacterized protein
MRKGDFTDRGGFPDLPIMEDVVLARELGQEVWIVTLRRKARTSARRFATLGAARTWFINQCVILCFLAGSDPGGLSRFYRSGGGAGEWLRFMGKAFGRRLGRARRQRIV